MNANPQFSLAFQGDMALTSYGELARRAEEHGFDGVSVYNDLYFQPCWPALLEMARATRRVRLGPAAVNPFTCHPVQLAGNLALLEQASHGRAYLGLARGAWLDELGLEPQKPISALREALLLIRKLLRGERGGFEGEVFSLPAGAGLRWDLPQREVPFLLGTWGERTLAACRDLVAEVKLGGTTSRQVVANMVARCGPAGPQVVVGAVTVVDEDGERARARARHEVALYLPVVAELDPGLEFDSKRLRALRRADELGRRELRGLIPDVVLERVAFAGAPGEVVEQTARLIEAGVGRVEFGTPHGLTRVRGLELLGREVLPALRRQFAT